MSVKIKPPFLISFEGAEGSGKSSVVREIHSFCKKNAVPVKTTIEPGGTATGKAIRTLLLEKSEPAICPLSELLLFLASRAQLIEEIITPALAEGVSVISDRFHDSSIVYQGIGRKLGVGYVASMNASVTNNFFPALTFVLDVETEVGLARIRERSKRDRFDEETTQFHRNIRQGFLTLVKNEPARMVLIDASKSLDSTVDQVVAVLEERIENFRCA
jgi:dTMP kinase